MQYVVEMQAVTGRVVVPVGRLLIIRLRSKVHGCTVWLRKRETAASRLVHAHRGDLGL